MNHVRVAFAGLGFVLAILSIALNDRWLGWAAIAALLVSVLVRLLLRKREDRNPSRAE